MFNHHDITRNAFMLHGPLAYQGYDWWWHSFTAQDAITGEDKPFFIEFFVCNPGITVSFTGFLHGRTSHCMEKHLTVSLPRIVLPVKLL